MTNLNQVRSRSYGDRLAVLSIAGYQKYLSPHKGFACAYRLLHNEHSCSQYIKDQIQERGLLQAIPLARQRFQACREAKITLQNQSRKKKRRQFNCADGCDDCIGSSCMIGECFDFDTPDCDCLDCNGLDCSGGDCDCCSIF